MTREASPWLAGPAWLPAVLLSLGAGAFFAYHAGAAAASGDVPQLVIGAAALGLVGATLVAIRMGYGHETGRVEPGEEGEHHRGEDRDDR